MYKKTVTWTEEFIIFEPGDLVEPTSNRHSLGAGIYEITECHIPSYPGDEVIVFVKGYHGGVSGEYLRLVKDTPAPEIDNI